MNQKENNILMITDKWLRPKEFYAKNSIQTNLIKIILISVFPAGFAGYNEWYMYEFSLHDFLTPF